MEATLEHHFEAGRLFLFPTGNWVIGAARALEQELQTALGAAGTGEEPRQLVIDLTELGALDTAGAFLLASVERRVADSGGHVRARGAFAAPG